jgi:hypothetical protein
MTFPKNVEEVEQTLIHAAIIRQAKTELENQIYTLTHEFQIRYGCSVHDIKINDGMGGVQGVEVEVRV